MTTIGYKTNDSLICPEGRQEISNVQAFYRVIGILQSEFTPEDLSTPEATLIDLRDISRNISYFSDSELDAYDVFLYLTNALRCFESPETIEALLEILWQVLLKSQSGLILVQEYDICDIICGLISPNNVFISNLAINFFNIILQAKIGDSSSKNILKTDISTQSFVKYILNYNLFEFSLNLALETTSTGNLAENTVLQSLIISILDLLYRLSFLMSNISPHLFTKLSQLVLRSIDLTPCISQCARITLFILFQFENPYQTISIEDDQPQSKFFNNTNSQFKISKKDIKNNLLDILKILIQQIPNPNAISARLTLVKVVSKLAISDDPQFSQIVFEIPIEIYHMLVIDSANSNPIVPEIVENVLLLASNIVAFGSDQVSIFLDNPQVFDIICNYSKDGLSGISFQALWLLWSMISAGSFSQMTMIVQNPIFEIMFDALDIDDQKFLNLIYNVALSTLLHQIFQRGLQNQTPFDSALSLIHSSLLEHDLPLPREFFLNSS